MNTHPHKFSRIIATSVLIATWGGTTPVQSAPQQTPSKDIVFIGNGYVRQLLEEMPKPLQTRSQFLPLSILSATPEDIETTMSKGKSFKPALVVFAFDLRTAPLETGMSTWYANARTILLAWKNESAKLIWISSPPPARDITAKDQRQQQAAASIETLLNNQSAFPLDLYTYVHLRRSDLFGEDGRDLTPSGWQLCSDVIQGRIQEVLREGEDPELPYVLVLGDSISNGYNIPVREELTGVANVRQIGSGFTCPPNWDAILRRVENEERKQGEPFAVIQVNWGLHAMKYVQESGQLGTPEQGSRCVSPEAYGPELRIFLEGLKENHRCVIWASTTPEHGVPWATDGDAEQYNAVARRVADDLGLTFNNLHDVVTEDMFLRRGDCHFTAAGSRRIGKVVADAIRQELESSRVTPQETVSD